MTCRDATDFLDAFLAHDLAPDVQAAFERHLTLCLNCQRFLRQYEQTVAAGRAACGADAETPIPDDLVRAILDSIRGTP